MSAPLPVLTDTWNAIGTAFTAIKMTVTDTASAVGSKLFDLIVGSTSMFQVGKNGHTATGAGAVIDYYDYFAEARPISVNVTENVGDMSISNYMFAGTINYTPTADNTNNYIFLFAPALYIPPTVNKHILGGIGCQYSLYDANQGLTDLMYGSNAGLTKDGGSIADMYVALDSVMALNATVTNMWGHIVQPVFNGTSHVTNVMAVGPDPVAFGGAWSVDNYFGFWHPDLAPLNHITNPYYFWTDGRGVTRIREEGAIKGGVYSWYNPNFTKYTPGAVNFERGVLQWNTGDVLEIGAEAGGTGTLRKIRHLGAGHIFPLANLPTSDPGVAGQLFTTGAPSAGVPKALMISGG